MQSTRVQASPFDAAEKPVKKTDLNAETKLKQPERSQQFGLRRMVHQYKRMRRIN